MTTGSFSAGFVAGAAAAAVALAGWHLGRSVRSHAPPDTAPRAAAAALDDAVDDAVDDAAAPSDASTPLPLVPLPPPSPSPAEAWAAAFLAQAQPIVAAHPGRVLFHAWDLESGRRVGLNDDEPAYLASGVKLLVMTEVMRLRALGKLRLDDSVRYRLDDVRDGAPSMNKRKVGERVRLRELLVYMVRDSDNAATDLLLGRLDVDEMRAWLAARGFRGIGPLVPMRDVRVEVYRRLDPRAAQLDAVAVRDVGWHPGFEPRLDLLKKHIGPPHGDYELADLDPAHDDYYRLGRNAAPMRTIAEILAALADEKLVAPAEDRQMLALLRQVWTDHRRVDRFLPAGTLVAHKTGTQHRRVVDLALIESAAGQRLVFTIVVEGGERRAAEDVVAELARRFFEHATAAP